jgi:acyl-CoA thioesterase YciA
LKKATEKPSIELKDPAVRVVLLPRDTNQHGTIFGGIILSYLDIAGGVEAHKHTDLPIVTVAMNKVEFKEPVRVGEVVSFYSQTLKVGKTSVTVHVDAEVDRHGQLLHVTSADLVFVAVDSNGRPTPIKP